MGPPHAWRDSAIRVKGDKDGKEDRRTGPYPRGLSVAENVVVGVKAKRAAGWRWFRHGVPGPRVMAAANRLARLGRIRCHRAWYGWMKRIKVV